MSQIPYQTANRVFWIIDNGSSHRGQPFAKRLQKRWPNAIAVLLPIHASWLNQIEIYFAIVQKKALTPNDSPDLQAVQKQVSDFQIRYQEVARPFSWKFTRKDLKDKLKLVSERIIEQHQPVTVTYQAPTIDNFPFWDQSREASVVFTYT
jgi:hypothetical protein